MRKWYDPIIDFFVLTKLGNFLAIVGIIFIMSILATLAFPDGFYIPVRVVQ